MKRIYIVVLVAIVWVCKSIPYEEVVKIQLVEAMTTLVLFSQNLTQDYLQFQVEKLADQKDTNIKQIKIVFKN